MAFTQSYIRANEQVAGIASVQFKGKTSAGVADVAYYSVGELMNGTLTLTELFVQTSYKKRRFFGYEFKVDFEALYTNKTNMVKILSLLSGAEPEIIVTEVSGKTWASELLTASPMGTGVGVDWEFTVKGDMGKNRFVKITAARYILTADVATMTGTAPVPGIPTLADVLHPLSLLTQADINSAGVEDVLVASPSGGTKQSLGSIRNINFTAKTVSKPDQAGRPHAASISLDLDVEAHQASVTELGQLAQFSSASADVEVNFVDGMKFTTQAQDLGVSPMYNLTKDMEDTSFIKFTFAGYIPALPATSWAGFIS